MGGRTIAVGKLFARIVACRVEQRMQVELEKMNELSLAEKEQIEKRHEERMIGARMQWESDASQMERTLRETLRAEFEQRMQVELEKMNELSLAEKEQIEKRHEERMIGARMQWESDASQMERTLRETLRAEFEQNMRVELETINERSLAEKEQLARAHEERMVRARAQWENERLHMEGTLRQALRVEFEQHMQVELEKIIELSLAKKEQIEKMHEDRLVGARLLWECEKTQIERTFVGECVVCLDNPPTVALVPCGHRCVCDACVAATSLQNCPICRWLVTGRIRIWT
eukprot:TRINITY_DN156_c0_g1_i2.p1 TRINITY_DN156_c0_g1~~TRINITY_DN156_c0_g1_i2.p1  ORF type:complete len:289 (+),score=49.11 TRINITY_DN156_c0_g1_i2:639-1505(+)